ncbi:MAG: hypothetical protein ACK56I_03225, partial [bacterium]
REARQQSRRAPEVRGEQRRGRCEGPAQRSDRELNAHQRRAKQPLGRGVRAHREASEHKRRVPEHPLEGAVSRATHEGVHRRQNARFGAGQHRQTVVILRVVQRSGGAHRDARG